MITQEQIEFAFFDFDAQFPVTKEPPSREEYFTTGAKWAIKKMQDQIAEEIMRREKAEAEVERLSNALQDLLGE